jgi:hypothetical protein
VRKDTLLHSAFCWWSALWLAYDAGQSVPFESLARNAEAPRLVPFGNLSRADPHSSYTFTLAKTAYSAPLALPPAGHAPD